MSESMAFIGGVAVAGLAALLLLKGSANNLVQPNFNATPQVQAPVLAPPMMAQPGIYPGIPVYPNQIPPGVDTTELRTQLERQKNQLDTLQQQNDQLKNQNQQFQSQIQTFYQSQLSAQQNQNSAQQAALQQSPEPWWSNGILWAVGGMALTVGGGIVVAGVSALFSQKQRPTRTVQVIHPYNGSGHNTISPPVRRAEFLPPRAERRMEAPEYDDTY
ncbi:MAG: heterocyst differentiation related protein [Rivularia sp. (in: cyanobacteria)]